MPGRNDFRVLIMERDGHTLGRLSEPLDFALASQVQQVLATRYQVATVLVGNTRTLNRRAAGELLSKLFGVSLSACGDCLSLNMVLPPECQPAPKPACTKSEPECHGA